MSVKVIERQVEILLVEDNPGDVRLVREAFKEIKLCNRLSVVGDGEKGIAFLKKEGIYHDAPHPDLILLDLNLPKIDGRELLEQIKQCPELRTIPIMVLTSSKSEEDILRSYELHANCKFTRQVVLIKFFGLFQPLGRFWFWLVNCQGG